MSPSSRTSGSRLKFRSSFADCSLPCLLTLSLVLLFARLQALELTTPKVIKLKFPVRLIQNNATEQQIDTRTHSNKFPSTKLGDAAESSLKSNSSSIQNGTTTTRFELATNQTGELAVASSPGLSLESNSQDQLLQQAAAELVASFNQPYSPTTSQFVDQPEAQNARSLAELTAAGTVAGLRLAHDLMAQANMVGEQSQPFAGLGTSQQREAPTWSNGGESIEAAMAANGGSHEDEAEAPSGAESWNDNGDNENSGDDGAGALPEARSDAGQLEAARNQMALANSGNNNGAQQQQQDEAEQPLVESQMPDSIESLMGADLDANVNEPEEGLGQAGELTNIDEAPDQQQPADSNNIYADNPKLLSGLSQQQLAAASASEGQDNENDDDDDDGQNHQQASQMRRMDAANSPATFRPAPVLLARNGLGRGPEMDHSNLVAPMRDSLVDLNSAAGHYYGKKKKKKKVKKVIVKKKKKKIKIKKYKFVKVKKMKKKKKYKKHYPKKYHHKKHHGHDHGKYYMYAKVPKKKSWEFGFKKGNKKHWISRHEKGHKNKFKTKVKWFDKKSKGKGIHVWDYNHHDKKKKKHHY